MSRLLGQAKFVSRQAAVVASFAVALGGAQLTLAQGTYLAPLLGERPTWMPEIPLSPTAVANGVVRSWDQRIEFVSVNVQNNPAFGGSGIPNGTGLPLGSGGDLGDQRFIGRGSVVQPFRIARFETSTQHWAEFVTAARQVQFATGSFGHALEPANAVIVGTPGIPGRFRAAPTPEAASAGGVDWRTAAMYCNWLHNDRAITRDAFLSGAHEVSTFA